MNPRRDRRDRRDAYLEKSLREVLYGKRIEPRVASVASVARDPHLLATPGAPTPGVQPRASSARGPVRAAAVAAYGSGDSSPEELRWWVERLGLFGLLGWAVTPFALWFLDRLARWICRGGSNDG